MCEPENDLEPKTYALSYELLCRKNMVKFV